MFRRKLLALDFNSPEAFNAADESQFRNLVIWLEDQKIRHYKIEDRAGLRNITNSDWPKICESYLQALGSPYQLVDRHAVIDWILGYAVRLEYGDNVEKYKGVTAESLQPSKTKAGVSTNPLDNLDFDDPDFKAGVASLSMILQVPPHPNHLEQLKAICILVEEKLSKEVLEQAAAAKATQKSVESIPLDKMELGFDTGDYIINEAAKILRLLHVKDLRDLQSHINAAIVGVQALIANPKTDSRLGKVGKG